jgi:MFS family permease
MRPGQWRVLLPLGVAILLSLSGDLTLYAVLPAQAPALGMSLGAVGLILSANRIVRLLSNPVAGLLLDRRARRPLFLCGMGLGTLSTLGYLAPGRLWLFLPARLLWGISWSLIYVGAYSMVVDITGPPDRGRASGVLQAFFFAGMALNPLLGGALSDRLGLRPALLACALLSALGLAVAFVALPETRRSGDAPEPVRVGLGPGMALPSRLSALRGLVRRPSMLAAGYLYLLAIFAGEGVVMSTISLFLRYRYGAVVALAGAGLPVATAGGALLALRSSVSILVAPFAGRLSDRAGRWGPLAWGLAAGVVGMVVLALGQNPLLPVLGVCLVALSGGVLCTILPALVADLAERGSQGAALGALMTAGDLGSAAAPLAAYGLLAVLPLAGTYLLCSLILASGLGVLWLAGRREAARAPESGQA